MRIMDFVVVLGKDAKKVLGTLNLSCYTDGIIIVGRIHERAH